MTAQRTSSREPIRWPFRAIDSAPDLEVVEVGDGAQAVARTRSTRLDIVLMDIWSQRWTGWRPPGKGPR